MDHDLDKARNMKLLLCAFEQLSGLKINFYKSELFCNGEVQKSIDQYTELFGCNPGALPMKYLVFLYIIGHYQMQIGKE
jgi:hypothetical protein